MSETNNGIPIEVNPTITLQASVEMGSRASENNAEAWAVGERGGVPVSSTDQTYHNNAKYYAQAAEDAAETASAAYGTNLLAPTYSATNTYAVGDHVIYDGGYYACNTAITTAEAWTAAHWTRLTVGGEASDLKTAFNNTHSVITVPTGSSAVSRTAYWIDSTGVIKTSNSSIILPVVPGSTYRLSTTFNDGTNYALLRDRNFVVNSAPNYATGYTGRVMVPKNTVAEFTAGDDANYIIIRADTDNMQNAITFKQYIDVGSLKALCGVYGSKSGIVIVSKGGEYKTIGAAVAKANANDIIYVMPGTYEEQVDAKSKNVHIIGYDKKTCILLDRSGMYNTPPLEISGGSVQNMTIIETGEQSSPTDSGTLPTLAYCIHIDWDNMTDNSLLISNCILKANKRATIGVGARNGFKLTVENCDLWSGVQQDTSHAPRGAFFCHTLSTGTDTTGMTLIMRNNKISCDDTIVMCLVDEGGIGVVCDFENNNLYSTSGGANEGIVQGESGKAVDFSGKLRKTENSFGNNVECLDYTPWTPNAIELLHGARVVPTSTGAISRVAYNIDANGIVKTTGNSIVVPIKAGRTYDIITIDRWNSNYSLLANNTLVANETPSYATGYTGTVTMLQNQKYTFTAPADAKYVIIRCDNDAGQNSITLTEYINIAALDDNIVQNKSFDLTGYVRKTGIINSNNVWANGGETAFVETVPGQELIIKTTYQYGSNYALVKSPSLTIGQVPDFCTGYTQRYSMSRNVEYNITVPNDCHYIAVRADQAMPNSAVTIKTKTTVLELVDDVSNSAKRINLGTNIVYVAASDSTDNDKQCADFVCTGTNDEITIQNAVNSVNGVMSGVNVVLMSGHYNIDSFPNTNVDGHVAIMLPSKRAADTIGTDVYSVMIKGAVYNSENVVIQVSQAAYNAMNTEDNYSVFAAENDWYYNHYAFHDLRVYVPSAQKKIVCYDGRRMGAMECRRLKAIALDHATWTTPVEELVLPNFHSIGVIGACWDSNSWNNIWESIYSIGFGQGFAVCGEHLLLIKCVAIYGRYGFTFHANMDASKVEQNLTPSHPDTLIDCSDEANANFWLFGGGNTRKPVINCFNLSIEHWDQWFELEGAGHYATEEVPGQFRGFMSYAHVGGNVSRKWWATDGSGQGFTTVNLNQEKIATSARRADYAPTIGQIVYDTTLNKAVICTDPATKEWRDMNGNIVI